MAAWIYTEDQAKKGGNNVASLLMKHLEHQGIIAQSLTEPFKEINLVMDNCGGQNKNQHVLRLLHFIVKRKIATVAEAIFLVRGHTKNDCDRLFNAMKKLYRKSNAFIPDDLISSISGTKNVDPIMVPPEAFKDWDKLENLYIKKPLGEVKHNHIFVVDINRNNGNSMWIQQSDGSDCQELKLVKQNYLDHDAEFWQSLQPDTIKPVSLQDIKWQELHYKWGRYILEEKETWKYYNEATPKEMIDAVTKHSKTSHEQRKGRTRTVHDDNKPQAKKTKMLEPTTDTAVDNKNEEESTGVI